MILLRLVPNSETSALALVRIRRKRVSTPVYRTLFLRISLLKQRFKRFKRFRDSPAIHLMMSFSISPTDLHASFFLLA